MLSTYYNTLTVYHKKEDRVTTAPCIVPLSRIKRKDLVIIVAAFKVSDMHFLINIFTALIGTTFLFLF